MDTLPLEVVDRIVSIVSHPRGVVMTSAHTNVILQGVSRGFRDAARRSKTWERVYNHLEPYRHVKGSKKEIQKGNYYTVVAHAFLAKRFISRCVWCVRKTAAHDPHGRRLCNNCAYRYDCKYRVTNRYQCRQYMLFMNKRQGRKYTHEIHCALEELYNLPYKGTIRGERLVSDVDVKGILERLHASML